MLYKLGRRAVRTDSRTFRLARYLTRALPPPPATRDWSCGTKDFGMMLNDTLGDCTIVGGAHAVQIWTANTATQVTIGDDAVLDAYKQWDGYDPSDASTDRGGIELDVLTKWRKSTLGGHVLTAFAATNVKDLQEIRQAINLFGGVYIGVALPLSAQDQEVWDVTRDNGGGSTRAGSWGGHCVYVVAYDQSSFTCITWGKVLKMTVKFWQKYCDEAYALFGADWLKEDKSPSGFNAAQLTEDLQALQ